MKHITLYSSASALESEKIAGYGFILRYGKNQKERQAAVADHSSNQMELKAVIEGLKLLKEPCDVSIITDAIYVVKGINVWLPKWQKRDFKKVIHSDLWRDYLQVSAIHQITAQRITDFVGSPELARCSAMAIEAIKEVSDHTNL